MSLVEFEASIVVASILAGWLYTATIPIRRMGKSEWLNFISIFDFGMSCFLWGIQNVVQTLDGCCTLVALENRLGKERIPFLRRVENA